MAERRWGVEYFGIEVYDSEEEARYNYFLATQDVPAWLVYNDGDGWVLEASGNKIVERVFRAKRLDTGGVIQEGEHGCPEESDKGGTGEDYGRE